MGEAFFQVVLAIAVLYALLVVGCWGHSSVRSDGSQQRIVLDAQSGTSDRFGATLCQAGLSFFKIAFRFAYDMLSI